jgi:putative ABC transport system permease protein
MDLMNTLQLLLAEIRYRKVNVALALLAVTAAVALFAALPMLLESNARQTKANLDELERDNATQRAALEKELAAKQAQFEAKTTAELRRLADETRKLMRDMGFNLMIVHRHTNMSDFWAADFAAEAFPQEYVERLAKDQRLTLVTHLVATLQEKVDWENRKVLLVGYLPEIPQSHMRHEKPMGYKIEKGTVHLGHELGVGRHLKDTVQIKGRPFRVTKILPERGSKEDITLAVCLSDAQELLGENRKGKINQILALGCNCEGSNLPNIRRQLSEILPDTQITEFQTIALARAEQRTLVAQIATDQRQRMAQNRGEQIGRLQERHQNARDAEAAFRARIQQTLQTLANVVVPLIVLACAVWVGLLALANVRERRTEIGVLRALGRGSSTIAGLFLGKAVLLGLVGAVVGLGVAWGLALLVSVAAFDVSPDFFTLHPATLLGALLGAPLISALASYLPTLAAVLQDPAVVLRDA